MHSHQNSHRLQIEIILRVEPAVHGVEGDVDVGDAVEDLGPEGRLVRHLGLAVAADQRHLEVSLSFVFVYALICDSHASPLEGGTLLLLFSQTLKIDRFSWVKNGGCGRLFSSALLTLRLLF